ncbi:hypothetical protein DFP74_2329 [Nocardiopsis sp. Huas11]|uniref:hypothetical protein n=1 Tax=Nocardiopsis sp. Huas11 TaxID=2183912 RepID=UPI000F23355E|nr:hypothetical protein [Nocardiopsis sp. Huas11]RKS06686.1 hypothetical protein DFP74_2329 [Nocardiopsis sp. Huas11]
MYTFKQFDITKYYGLHPDTLEPHLTSRGYALMCGMYEHELFLNTPKKSGERARFWVDTALDDMGYGGIEVHENPPEVFPIGVLQWLHEYFRHPGSEPIEAEKGLRVLMESNPTEEQVKEFFDRNGITREWLSLRTDALEKEAALLKARVDAYEAAEAAGYYVTVGGEKMIAPNRTSEEAMGFVARHMVGAR